MRSVVIAIFMIALAGCRTVNTNPGAWVPPGPGPSIPDWPDTGGDTGPRAMRVGDRVGIQMSMGAMMVHQLESTIDEHGRVPLPIIGAFKIADMTPSAANLAIAQEYTQQRIYTEIVVNVTNLTVPPPPMDVFFARGQFRSGGGQFPLTPGIRLSEAIMIAGGTTDFASDNVWLIRGDISQKYSLKDLQRRRGPDPVLMNRDVIHIDRSII